MKAKKKKINEKIATAFQPLKALVSNIFEEQQYRSCILIFHPEISLPGSQMQPMDLQAAQEYFRGFLSCKGPWR